MFDTPAVSDAKPRILIVDDDPFVRDVLEIYLTSEGYRVAIAGSGEEMRERLVAQGADLVLMDVKLPGEDGFTLTRHLRSHHKIGIIIITTRHETVDKVVGLECGADDYVIKPFEEREVLARIRSVLRRTQERAGDGATGANGKRLTFHGVSFDPSNGSLHANGQDLTLTGHECRLLTHLVRNAGQPQGREELMTQVLQRPWSPLDRSIDVLITRLRQKVESDPRHPEIIKTVRGTGYVVYSP
jgi:DNA-binding response OmpR family regulator